MNDQEIWFQDELEVLVERYINDANEHEDQPLTEAEVKRLRDLVTYSKELNR